MSLNKISYNFHNKESAINLVKLLGANCFDYVAFYPNDIINKGIKATYSHGCAVDMDKKLIKEIKEHFKLNCNGFIHFKKD